jgi:hypothetical protein
MKSVKQIANEANGAPRQEPASRPVHNPTPIDITNGLSAAIMRLGKGDIEGAHIRIQVALAELEKIGRQKGLSLGSQAVSILDIGSALEGSMDATCDQVLINLSSHLGEYRAEELADTFIQHLRMHLLPELAYVLTGKTDGFIDPKKPVLRMLRKVWRGVNQCKG